MIAMSEDDVTALVRSDGAVTQDQCDAAVAWLLGRDCVFDGRMAQRYIERMKARVAATRVRITPQ